jgi:hypothetical protein
MRKLFRRKQKVLGAEGRLGAGVVTAVVALVGCGGNGGGSTATALSKADYIAKADAICAQKRQQRSRLVTVVQNAIASGVSASDAHRVRDISNRAADYVDQLARELEALPKPTGDEQILDDLLSTVRAEAADLRHFADALDSHDASQIRSFGEAADSDGARAVNMAFGYGFAVCGRG